MSSPLALHAWTPAVSSIDARGLQVNTVGYYRRNADEAVSPRRERQGYDVLGRLVAQWDARLGPLAELDTHIPANQTSTYGLAGQVLMTQSVDAGWRLALYNETDLAVRAWDSRGSRSRVEYDALLRPVAVFEQSTEGTELCAERMRYADNAQAANNLCGHLVQHDDTAGRQEIILLGLTGDLLVQSRRFLATDQPPDWPVAPHDAQELLEPGAGAITRATCTALGEPTSQTDAKGNRQRFAYNVAGQLDSTWVQLAGQEEQNLLSDVHCNAQGQIEEQTAGNGVRTQAAYSPVDGQLEHLRASKGSGAVLQDLFYTYDPVGNVLSIRDDAQAVRHFNNQRVDPVSTYSYDTFYQLIEATGREAANPSRGPALPALIAAPADPNQLANYTQTFTYDAGGNLTRLRHVGAQSYTQDMDVAAHSNRSVIKEEQDLATAFDANGNLLQLQPGQRLNWDLRNQLQQVTPVKRDGADDDYERYTYDAGGQRLRKVRNTQARAVTHRAEVRYLPGLELRTDTATGENLHVVSVTAGSGSARVLHWEAGKPDGIDNDQIRYSLSDHLGSNTLELDAAGAVISQEGYYPYGGTAWRAGRNDLEAKYKTIRYSGKERDATGLYYYGIRYYAPWLQRWINPDPWGAIDGLNIYRFTGNNPIGNVDEEGGVLTPADRRKFLVNMLGIISKPRSDEETYILPTKKFHKELRESLVQAVKGSGGRTRDAEAIFDEAIKTHDIQDRVERFNRHREAEQVEKAERLRRDYSRALGYIYSTNIGQARIKEGLKKLGLATGVTDRFGTATDPVEEIEKAFGPEMLDKDIRRSMKFHWKQGAEDLAKSFLESRDFRPVPKLFRGDTSTMGAILNSDIAANEPYTAPTVLSAAWEEHVADKYQTGTMLEMSGEAALVESIYGEGEFVFRPGARFSVSKIGTGRYRLQQI